MVTVDKIQRGVSRYLDEQLMPHLQGKDRWIMTGIASLMMAKLPNLVQTYATKPAIMALGVIGSDGTVDIENIINSVRPAAKHCPAQIPIPLTGGSITITEQDLDVIQRYIMQS